MTLRRLVYGIVVLAGCLGFGSAAWSGESAAPAGGGDFQVEVTKKGLGKEVTIRKGNREWFLMVEVTPENTVVIRQEKENETFLVDESETHDHPLSAGEVDTAIQDYINSVKSQSKKK